MGKNGEFDHVPKKIEFRGLLTITKEHSLI